MRLTGLRYMSTKDRFILQTSPCPNTGCWFWTGTVANHGYGYIKINGKNTMAHRFSWELHNGPIPDGLVIDHLCRVRSCVNPAHLRVVTFKENVLCGTAPTALNAAKTKCGKCGGSFITVGTNKRDCLMCKRRRQLKSWHKRKGRDASM